jgi:putative lipoic acid-binding regulatory protein
MIKDVKYRLGDNIHKQPVDIERRMQYGTHGPWQWEIHRGVGSYQDTNITICGISDAQIRELYHALRDHFKDKP